jgi:hypothetical protein
LRAYAEEGAIAVGVQVEMVAVPLIVAAGAAIGRHRILRLKPGFEQLPVLFAGVVAPPGSAKSPALSTALRPLKYLQHCAVQQYRQALQQAEAHPGGAQPVMLPPTLDHLYTTDATAEATTPMLVSSPGLLAFHDELLGAVLSCNAYRGGRGADRQHLLSAWSFAPIKVDRKGAPSLYVARPALSILGGTQPEVLPQFHNPNGGRDGLLERFLWICPDTTPALWSADTISEQTADEVNHLFAALRQPPAAGSSVIDLAPDARGRWIDWYNANQLRVAERDGLEAGFTAKLPNQVARLGLILHAMGDPYGHQRHLSMLTLDAAIALGEYFRGQFRIVLPLITGPAKSRSKSTKTAVASAISEAGSLSRTQLHKVMHGGISSHDLDQVLAELQSEGRVMKEMVNETGGRPAEYWRWIRENRSEPRRDNEVA